MKLPPMFPFYVKEQKQINYTRKFITHMWLCPVISFMRKIMKNFIEKFHEKFHEKIS